MAPATSEHELLVRHFSAWAQAKNKRVDDALMDELLTLRFTYDDLEPTYWPTGSVTDLLVRRWPLKGNIAPPDESTLVETLDAYFRFLRSTGRMSARSATPAGLSKEARRGAPAMAAAAADVSAWSPGKVMQEYGRSIGISLDGAPDIETLQARLNEVQDAWNALPFHERRRRMPHQNDDPALSGAEQAMAAYRVDDPTVALVYGFNLELPSGTLPEPTVVAPIARSASFVRTIVAMTEWIGPRIEVTSTGVLRPDAAHEAYDTLELDGWTRDSLRRYYQHYQPAGVLAVGLETWLDQEARRPWRYAADCAALDRIWRGAVAGGAIEISGRWAYPRLDPEQDDEQWVSLAVRAAVELLEDLRVYPAGTSGLVYGLLRSYVRGCAVVPWDEIIDFVEDWDQSSEERQFYRSIGFDMTPSNRALLSKTCGAVVDTGAFSESRSGMQLTAFGDVLVSDWLRYVEDAPSVTRLPG